MLIFQAYAKHLQKTNPKAYFDYCPSMTEYSTNGNLVERFVALKVPRVFIYGSKNKHLAYLQTLREGGVQVAEIPNSSHFPGYDNPQAYYQAIADFSDRILE